MIVVLSTHDALSNRLQNALDEIDAKKAAIEKLKEDVKSAEENLMQSQENESQWKDQLEVAKKEVKKLSQKLCHISG